MTGFSEEVGNFRRCSNHASEMRFLRSRRWSACDGAVRVPSALTQNQIVQKSACVNLAERFLRGVVGKLLERSYVRFLRAVVVPLARRDFPVGSLVEIFEIEAASPRRLTREDDSVPSYAVVETFKETVEFALDALRMLRDRSCPCGNRVNNRLKRFRLRLESERVVQRRRSAISLPARYRARRERCQEFCGVAYRLSG